MNFSRLVVSLERFHLPPVSAFFDTWWKRVRAGVKRSDFDPRRNDSLEFARVIACTRPSRVSRCTTWTSDRSERKEDRRSRKIYFRFSNKSQFECMRVYNRAFHLPKQFHNDAWKWWLPEDRLSRSPSLSVHCLCREIMRISRAALSRSITVHDEITVITLPVI